MGLVEFTQYLLPNGRKVKTTIEIEDEGVAAMADTLVSEGMRLEIEVLQTREVSATKGYVTIHWYGASVERTDSDGEDETVAIRIFKNEPGVVARNIRQLIEDAYERTRPKSTGKEVGE